MHDIVARCGDRGSNKCVPKAEKKSCSAGSWTVKMHRIFSVARGMGLLFSITHLFALSRTHTHTHSAHASLPRANQSRVFGSARRPNRLRFSAVEGNERGAWVRWQWTVRHTRTLCTHTYAHTHIRTLTLYLFIDDRARARILSPVRLIFIWELKLWYNFNDGLFRFSVSNFRLFLFFPLPFHSISLCAACNGDCMHKKLFPFRWILNVTLSKYARQEHPNKVNSLNAWKYATRQRENKTTL